MHSKYLLYEICCICTDRFSVLYRTLTIESGIPSFFVSIFCIFRLCICKSVFFMSVCLSVFMSVCLCKYLFVRLSVYINIRLSVFINICLSVYINICLSVCINICLSVCLIFRMCARKGSDSVLNWRARAQTNPIKIPK